MINVFAFPARQVSSSRVHQHRCSTNILLPRILSLKHCRGTRSKRLVDVYTSNYKEKCFPTLSMMHSRVFSDLVALFNGVWTLMVFYDFFASHLCELRESRNLCPQCNCLFSHRDDDDDLKATMNPISRLIHHTCFCKGRQNHKGIS